MTTPLGGGTYFWSDSLGGGTKIRPQILGGGTQIRLTNLGGDIRFSPASRAENSTPPSRKF